MGILNLQIPGAGTRAIEVAYAVNGGYAGRDTAAVQAHVDELAELGVPAPSSVPTAYWLSAVNVAQTASVQVPHDRTSGEAEWALIIGDGPDDAYLAAACDHTDRALEVHGVAWSKQSAPDVIGDVAWPLAEVAERFDDFTLKAWVSHDGDEQLIQDGTAGELLSPGYWLDRLDAAGLARPGTIFVSGTIPMLAGVDQFGDGWRVELTDPTTGATSRVHYEVERLPDAWD